MLRVVLISEGGREREERDKKNHVNFAFVYDGSFSICRNC